MGETMSNRTGLVALTTIASLTIMISSGAGMT
jgi:hypothetical protein